MQLMYINFYILTSQTGKLYKNKNYSASSEKVVLSRVVVVARRIEKEAALPRRAQRVRRA